MGKLTRTQTALSVAFIVLAWGSAWPIYKVALQFSPPLLFAGIRSLFGGILFSLFLLPQWRHLRWKQSWPVFAISAFFNTVVFLGVQSIGLQYLPAGLYSVIVYLQPVLVVILAWAWLKEMLTAMKIVGILIGFAGVVFVSLDGISGNISLLGVAFAIITGAGWAVGTMYVKKTKDLVHGLWLVAIQNLIGGVVMFAGGFLTEDVSRIQWNTPFALCLLFGGFIGVTAAPSVYFKLMNSGESSKVSSYTFLVPMTSVLIGTICLNEPLTLSLLAGMAMIMLSIYLMNRRERTLPRALPE